MKLDIYQEVSSIDAQSANSTAGIITNKRALDTSVLLDDSQIMVLGGLLEDGVSHGRDAVPGLGKIPVLGALFRSDTRKRAKTNLMVFLRPHVVRDPAGQRLTRDRYDYMRNAQAGAQPVQSWALPALSAPQLPPQDLSVLGQGNARDGRGQPLQNTSLAALYPSGDGDAQLVQFAQGLDPGRASQGVAQVRALGLQAYAEATPGEAGNACACDCRAIRRRWTLRCSSCAVLGYAGTGDRAVSASAPLAYAWVRSHGAMLSESWRRARVAGHRRHRSVGRGRAAPAAWPASVPDAGCGSLAAALGRAVP